MSTLSSNYVIVSIMLSIWSGKARVKAEDLPDHVVKALPPAELASLGTKTLIDPKRLTPLTSMKTAVHRYCSGVGVKFLGGFMIDRKIMPDVEETLGNYKKAFDDIVEAFCYHYDEDTAAWLSSHSEWAPMLATALPTKEEIEGKFKFNWAIYTIDPANTETETILDSVTDAAAQELADIAANIRESTFPADRATKFTAKTLAALDPLVTKARNVAFIDPKYANVSILVDQLKTISSLPLMRLGLEILSDPHKLADLCETPYDILAQIGSGQDIVDAVATPEPEPQPTVYDAQPQPEPTSTTQAGAFTQEFLDQFGGLF